VKARLARLAGRIAVAIILLVLDRGGTAAAQAYQTSGTCAGFPATSLQTPSGICVGVVAEHLGFARGVTMLGDAIYLLDMGGWRPGHGRLLRLGHLGHDAPQVLLSGLDEPSGLAVAPDSTLYIGLLGRVVRLDPHDPTLRLDDVVTGLPGTGRHPLTTMAVAPDGSLYINVGSGTDHCEGPAGAAPDPKAPCPEAAGTPPRGSLIHVVPHPGQPVTWAQAQTVATGLRNSMGLVVTPGGTLIAAVNARDGINRADSALPDAEFPHDTLDVIEPGAAYGWPYCFDNNRPSPEYREFDCTHMQPPTLLLPPHAAPLGMLLYQGDALPGLAGRLVIPYHGYRGGGHRLVSVALDETGHPAGSPKDLVWGWTSAPGHNPMGSPVAVAEMPDGSILITEDRNGILLRLAPQ
jgi:glucose/arabinose dehydrogenase